MNTNEIKQVYTTLLEALKQGKSAAIVTNYNKTNIEKQFVDMSNKIAASSVLLQINSNNAVTAGPVTSINANDGSFTTIERYNAKPRVIILGAGHIAMALCPMATLCDFEVIVYDDRPAFANNTRFPAAAEVICDNFDKLFERVKIKNSDFVVIVTRGHRHDSDCLTGVLNGIEPAYTGMIGSKRRVAIVLDKLKSQGFTAERLDAIHTPIGLKIAAVTPAEISVSILAEMIMVKRSLDSSDSRISADLEAIDALCASTTDYQAMITILNSEGSVPIDAGAKLVMTYSGQIKGTIGGGCSESEAMQIARELINKGGWRRHVIDMGDNAEDDGMVCGGEMEVVIEHL